MFTKNKKLKKILIKIKANPESLHIARQMIFFIFELASKEIIKDDEAMKVFNLSLLN